MMTPTAPSQKEPEIKNTFEITPSLHIIPNRISDHGIERILSTIILYSKNHVELLRYKSQPIHRSNSSVFMHVAGLTSI